MSHGLSRTRQTRRKSRGDLYAADCPSRGILDHIATRWSSLILVMLLEKTHRFSELARRIGGVSERMLAHSLQALEADGFVLRVVYRFGTRRSCSGTHPVGGGQCLASARPPQGISTVKRLQRRLWLDLQSRSVGNALRARCTDLLTVPVPPG